jgi:hypothetical protein
MHHEMQQLAGDVTQQKMDVTRKKSCAMHSTKQHWAIDPATRGKHGIEA